MKKIQSFLYKFMYGRYGIDELYKFSVLIYFILIIINLFLRNNILSMIEVILAVLIIYRSFSKNIKQRRKENNKYMFIKNRITSKFSIMKKRFLERNTNIYRKCPKCKETLRLPLKKGTHTVKCPKCANRFDVKCRKDIKGKVIRK